MTKEKTMIHGEDVQIRIRDARSGTEGWLPANEFVESILRTIYQGDDSI